MSGHASTFLFIGVTTGQSSIMRVFPRWMEVLGHPEVSIDGVDLPPHAPPADYRRAVGRIAADASCLGALVTTHKIDLLAAAADLFDDLGHYARVCGEVSCIAKRAGALHGYALDPVAGGRSLDEILGQRHFSGGSDVLCFGAGGAATAIALHLIEKQDPPDRPGRFIVVNRSPGRLGRLCAMVERLDTSIAFEYVLNEDARRNDALMASLPPRSVVINATGMGKDRPGSPVTDQGAFPLDGVAWELNYRGALDFLHQAESQGEARRLAVVDGWRYFLHGWSEAVARVLDIKVDAETFRHLGEVAAEAR